MGFWFSTDPWERVGWAFDSPKKDGLGFSKEILNVCDFLEGAFLLENEFSLEMPPDTF